MLAKAETPTEASKPGLPNNGAYDMPLVHRRPCFCRLESPWKPAVAAQQPTYGRLPQSREPDGSLPKRHLRLLSGFHLGSRTPTTNGTLSIWQDECQDRLENVSFICVGSGPTLPYCNLKTKAWLRFWWAASTRLSMRDWPGTGGQSLRPARNVGTVFDGAAALRWTQCHGPCATHRGAMRSTRIATTSP